MPLVIPVSIKSDNAEMLDYIKTAINKNKEQWGWISRLSEASTVSRATIYSLFRNGARPQDRTIRDVYYAIIELEKNRESA